MAEHQPYGPDIPPKGTRLPPGDEPPPGYGGPPGGQQFGPPGGPFLGPIPREARSGIAAVPYARRRRLLARQTRGSAPASGGFGLRPGPSDLVGGEGAYGAGPGAYGAGPMRGGGMADAEGFGDLYSQITRGVGSRLPGATAATPVAPSFDPYDPNWGLSQIPGVSDLMDPMGSSTLYNALSNQITRNAGAASRRAVLAATLRGEGGSPYGVFAQEAEREALSGGARGLMDARSESIRRNQEFAAARAGDYSSFLQQKYRDEQQERRDREMELLRQAFERWRIKKTKKRRIGIGPVGVSF